MTTFDPATADLTDPTVRAWTCAVTGSAPTRRSRLAAGAVVEVYYADTVEPAFRVNRAFLNGKFTLEERAGTNAEAAAWLSQTATAKREIDRTAAEAKALREPTWDERMFPGRTR